MRTGSIAGAFLITSALTACSSAGPPEPAAYEIRRDNAERVLATLASDEMRGRRAFTRDIERAASFLNGEFRSIGLQVPPGQDDFRQEFSVRAVTPSDVSVSINGTQVSDAQVVASVTSESVVATEADLEFVHVAADDNPGEVFAEVRGQPGTTLVLMDPAHEAFFGRLRSFLSRPNVTLADGGSNQVFVLSPVASIRSARVEISAAVEERPLANVVGMIPGRRSNELVLFSAHYDHIGIRPPVNGDSIANGANDDASGVTAVVELARYFASRGTPERTLVFAAFTAEEGGGYGSRYFSQQFDPDEIVAMFNIEMIGKEGPNGPNTAWITGYERSDFGEILNGAVQGTEYSFHPDPYPSQNLFYRSDNATLARLGVPAHSISTTQIDTDPDYHQVSDEIETIEMEHLVNTIRALAAGARTIVAGDATPTRVDTSQVN